jgi:hypothetical protein
MAYWVAAILIERGINTLSSCWEGWNNTDLASHYLSLVNI